VIQLGSSVVAAIQMHQQNPRDLLHFERQRVSDVRDQEGNRKRHKGPSSLPQPWFPYLAAIVQLPSQKSPRTGGEAGNPTSPLVDSPSWCNVVTTILQRHATMKRKKGERRSMKTRSATLVRASISFPPDLYETLE
jgi:hypothetical protein